MTTLSTADLLATYERAVARRERAIHQVSPAATDAVAAANVEITTLRTEIARRINTGTPPF